MNVGRNNKCPCGSGQKYKKCCLDEDERKVILRQKVMNITRRDFISGPYKNCPNSECLSKNTFGVFITMSGDSAFSRECTMCGHQESFDLPQIRKKVIYLDQFVISNLIKLLDKTHPSHEAIKAIPFWETLFIKLEKATKFQAIVCPDSFYHQEESLTSGINFKLTKRLYEHFSSGKTLYPSHMIQKNQIIQHFEGWLDGKKVEFTFNPEDIAFERDLHSWSVGLMISVGGNPYAGQVDGIQKSNSATREQLKNVWGQWQSEKNTSFTQRVKDETLGLGKGLMEAARQFFQRRAVAMAKMASGENYEMNLDDFMPPMSNDLLQELMRIAGTKGFNGEQVGEVLAKYFNDVDSLLEIPQIRISSVMFAGWANRATNGKKEPPKSTVDVQFISSYLPYCDAMFVDKESALLLKEFPKNTPTNLRLTEFPTKVFSLNNQIEFLNYLDQLVTDVPSSQVQILNDMQGADYGKPYWSIIEREKREMSEGK